MKLLWKILSFVAGIVALYIILNWIGFDMGNFSDLWNTFLQCFRDVARETKGILK